MGLFDRLRGSDPRVAFIGIDGVPYELVMDNPDVFPNLHAIHDDGTGGRIESIVPPESSACWPALTCGTNPGVTGVYGFTDREPNSYETYIPMGSHVKGTRVWDRVQQTGRGATVINVPVTVPPQDNVQRMVSGFLSPDLDTAAHPPAFREALATREYEIDVDPSLGHEEDKTDFIEAANNVLDGRQRAFEYVIDEDDWDLLFGVFMTTDRVNHFLFKDYTQDGEYYEEFIDFYRRVDEYIGVIREQLDEDTTLIVASDHGFTEEHYEAHLNNWLYDEGWLDYDTDDPEELADISDDTKAYSLIPGRFYLNLDGREPRGSVSETEYESVREDLATMLEDLEGPDGESVIDRVVTKDAAYDGPYDDQAPDLVAIPENGFDLKAGFSDPGPIFDTGPRTGMHRFDNACLFIDDPDATIPEDTNLYDIAPTILDTMDIEYPDADFDGKSLV